jgi:glycoprotein-N-acetylgalactosamine 3-beta-galactosyltransferase
MSFGLDRHLTPEKRWNNFYFDELFYESEQGMDCCSDIPAEIHNLKNIKELFLLQYFIYHVDIFGADKRENETLPRKFKMNEVLEMAQMQSNSKFWKFHKINHSMDADEFY